MPDDIVALTEKEKETPRLLLAGYDAKSSAHELDVSVHTLNHRLRSARRKLGVTTSKEAARIVAQAKGNAIQTSPKPLVHKGLGIRESEEILESVSAADRSEVGLFPLMTRRKGILIMSISIALVAAVLVGITPTALTDSVDSGNTVSTPSRPADSELKARRFVGLIDAGLFDESYAEAGQALRDEYAPNKWKFGLTLRMTNGKIQSRELARLKQTSEYAGRESGRFEIVEFNSLFEKNNRMTERIVLRRGPEGWEVVDYEIVGASGAAN
ncbi:DUF4019 domain-containing protein [uncultured Erythrobacter sp.]|uniref:DUF4019 domain-containing protein n=1 Tax=uncultured Erythrobacter sp. TaxID=263913 RepID=UPI00262402F8|nr:DUF4019 domain-containing protein [uncultured Erythrobacter sp.]